MNILLLYPKMPDTFYAMSHFIKVIGKKAAYPPLGLLTVASLLPAKWNKKLVDLNVENLTEADLQWVDFLFLSAMNVQAESVFEIIARCKKANVKIVAGGPLFTHEYQRFPDIDHFVLNEAEITLPKFVEDLKNNTLKQIYASQQYADITQTPLPLFHLANMDNYLFSIVQYSRGCPFMCDFCDVTALFGRVPRLKTSMQIIAELEEILKHGNTQLVLFADDNLIGNKKAIKEDLLPELIKWRIKRNPGFFFATQLSINLADDDHLMQMLLDAGFRHIFVGIETTDEEGLKSAKKSQNLKRNQLENIQKLHHAGFIVSGGFIVGFDTDTEKTFEQQAEFIRQSGIPLPIVNILKAPVGTQLFEKLEAEGRIVKQFAFSEGDTNIATIMDLHTLEDKFLTLNESICLPNNSAERIINFLTMYRYPKTTVQVKTSIKLQDIWVLLRVVYFLGITDKDRQYFWKLLKWTFFNNRSYLDKALFYGIMIYQMKQTHNHIKQTILDRR